MKRVFIFWSHWKRIFFFEKCAFVFTRTWIKRRFCCSFIKKAYFFIICKSKSFLQFRRGIIFIISRRRNIFNISDRWSFSNPKRCWPSWVISFSIIKGSFTVKLSCFCESLSPWEWIYFSCVSCIKRSSKIFVVCCYHLYKNKFNRYPILVGIRNKKCIINISP